MFKLDRTGVQTGLLMWTLDELTRRLAWNFIEYAGAAPIRAQKYKNFFDCDYR